MATVTLDDVAKRAGVSKKTVSRVLNNEPRVAAPTLEKVKSAIAELDYVPNVSARKLSSGKTMAIGMVFGWQVSGPFVSELIESALQESNRHDYNLFLYSIANNDPMKVIEAYLGKQVDGFILDTLAGKNKELVHRLNSLNVPYVLIHPTSKREHPNASFVRINDELAAKQATEYLLRLGHRCIGYIGFHAGITVEKDRLSGYQQALQEAGIPFREEWAVRRYGTSPFGIAYELVTDLISHQKQLTAVFASTDALAMGALSAIWHMGLRIPDDISVIGFDDIAYASMTAPPLTTIHQPLDEIASLAVRLLIDKIEDPSAKPVDLVLPTRLVVRDSCKPFSDGQVK
jgi:LacI family transcriptional regulator